jgi:nitrite reductase (NO-forming)
MQEKGLRARQLLLAFLAALALAGCGTRGSDDEAGMDLHPTPARLTQKRHVGPLSAGSALSVAPAVRPLDPAHDKTIQIDVANALIELAPGVPFRAWTFGGTVPGPIIRARVGDRIHFSMTNRSDENIPGSALVPVPMMHSIDFHAAMVSPQDKYRSIAPGQTIEFEFTPNYPGFFMYHCGTPMILEHIASGMYGAMIVEPRNGYPTRVDREYVVVQSEFYTRDDPDGRKIGGAPLQVLDTDRVRTKASTYTVFNGVYNGMVDHPLTAKPGERVRLFVLNVGPSNTSSFHVVGTIFDRVWQDGNPANQLRGMQTVLLGSSSSAIVEFRVPEAGKYVMVDHHFANASQGAIGILDATAGRPEEAPLEHHNIPATGMPSDPVAAHGKMIFELKCLACHSMGQGPRLGPDLAGVTLRRDDRWIERWLTSPAQMLASDDTARAVRKRFALDMPNQQLSPEDIRGMLSYFHWTASGTDSVHAHAAP